MMQHKLLHATDGLRTFAVVLSAGDEPVASLQRFAHDHGISGAQLTGIGALSRVTLGYFDWDRKEYDRIVLDEQVEVLTLAGNIGRKDGEPALHAHIVVGRKDGSACGGHLLDAAVRPTLEVMVIETPRHLWRRLDDATGLALIDPSL
jgi:predicted DNA-binding protein with PD1-like motif